MLISQIGALEPIPNQDQGIIPGCPANPNRFIHTKCPLSRLLRLVPAGEASKTKEEDGGVPSSSCCILLCLLFGVGGDLLSHNLPVAVPSACAGLASGFGMGPGVSLQLLTTDKHAKHKPLLFGCPPRGGCCVRYCIVDAVTTVTVSFSIIFLLSYTSVLVFVVVN